MTNDCPMSKEGNPKACTATKKFYSYIHLQKELINLHRTLEI